MAHQGKAVGQREIDGSSNDAESVTSGPAQLEIYFYFISIYFPKLLVSIFRIVIRLVSIIRLDFLRP